MVLKLHTDALNKLCTKDQLELLDSIDTLRSQGISHYVSLPQIIVCGDQSSGKSSVLEAISGVSFPIKSNLCTRFPTELVLRKTAHVGVSVSIVPHNSRTEVEKKSLSSFHQTLDSFEGLPTLIDNAKATMGILTHGKAFSKDILRVEVSGPDRPHLTIVDLPGLVHSETKQQSASDVELVQDVVRFYMKEPRSIILAVVSAKNDYPNQIVLRLAREADKTGVRTLGVITKPDTLTPGSDSEGSYVSLARNHDVEFRLGWHVLKNMDSETGRWVLAQRDAEEIEFFSRGIWSEHPPSLMGIDALRNRLSKLLLHQIASELPSLIEEIESKSEACRGRLSRLGEPRTTFSEQQLYLFRASQLFQTLIKAAVDGTYNDAFFGSARSEPGYQKRIRALMQNLNLDFAERMTRRGHSRQIVDGDKDAGFTPRHVERITRSAFIEHVRHLMRRTRGRELPGTFNPMIVADLFLEQSAPWEAIAQIHVDSVWKAVKDFLSLAITHVADAATAKALLLEVFEPALDKLKVSLNDKTAELLKPHQKSHPITYSREFADTLHRVRNENKRAKYAEVLKDIFHIPSTEQTIYINQSIDFKELLTLLTQLGEPDMDSVACSEALDCMDAYYKVALRRFIDDIAIEVIEARLVAPLADIFSPVAVAAMPAALIPSIAGESDESCALRGQLARQLDVLATGAETCRRFVGARLFDATDATPADSDNDARSGGLASDLSGGWRAVAHAASPTRSESSDIEAIEAREMQEREMQEAKVQEPEPEPESGVLFSSIKKGRARLPGRHRPLGAISHQFS